MLQLHSKHHIAVEKRMSSASVVRVCFHVLGTFGNDVRAKRAALALQKAGFQVVVVDIAGESLHPTEEIDGMIVKHMRVHKSFTATRFKRWILLRSAWMFLRSTIYLLRSPSDIYHALDLPALPACYIAACLRRKPVVFDSYELPLSTLSEDEMSQGRRLLQALLAPILKHIIPRCAGVIAVSPPIAEEMSRRYPGTHITIVRNIPPYQAMMKSERLRQQLGLDPQTRIALYQGYLQPDRRLDRLVHAARFLKPGIVLVMMGKGTPETLSLLESLITSEGVAERVKILPPVPYDDLLGWTSSADIGLLIYSPDYSLNVRLCLPNKLFEFLMAGLPVLASPLDAVAEITRTYTVGQLVPSLAPEDIGAAINTMLDDAQELERMHQNALQAAQHCFCWEKEQQQLLHLYDGLRVN